MVSATADTDSYLPTVISSQPSSYCRLGKRSLDVVLSSVAIIVLTPVLLLISLALRISMGNGILFTQRRIGRGGEEFTCLKFRTMDNDRRHDEAGFPGDDRRETHKSTQDPRHTSVGRCLRKYSLDELPQLFNVVRGDMSLIGPRPEMVAVASAEFINHVRHRVRPGLTGPYQVSDLRLTGDLENGLSLDEDYVDRVSFLGDLKLIGRTFGVILSGSGE